MEAYAWYDAILCNTFSFMGVEVGVAYEPACLDFNVKQWLIQFLIFWPNFIKAVISSKKQVYQKSSTFGSSKLDKYLK